MATTAPTVPPIPVDQWAERYLAADELERRLVAAALRCVARWGLSKTSLDDIAREAGVGRATAYRVFPGGKDRWVETVLHHELGRMFRQAEVEAAAASSLGELLCFGVAAAMRMLREHEALAYMIQHEPEAVLPHFAFHRLDRLLAAATELSRPHLGRFLPEAAIRPAAELLARVVLTYSFDPGSSVDPGDPASIRRLVETYLLPAVTSTLRPAVQSPKEQQ